MSGFVVCLGTDPLWAGGIGGDTAAVLPGLKLCNRFILLSSGFLWTTLKCGSHQSSARLAGTNSILFYSILFYSILFYSILFYSILFYSILFYSILSI